MFVGKKMVKLLTSMVLAMSLVLVGVGCANGSGGSSNTSGAGGSSEGSMLLEDGYLIVGSDCDYPPFIEMNGEQPQGFEYDLLDAVAQEMGLQVKFLPPQSFEGILASLASNNTMDVAASAFTINPERSEMVDFCTPYYDSNQAVVTLDGTEYVSSKDLNGLVIGAQDGTTGADWAEENLSSDTTLIKYNQVSEVMAALLAGTIEAAIYDEPTAVHLTSEMYPEAQVIEVIFTGEQYGIAVSKDNPELKEAINAALIAIKKDGTFDEIYARYFPGVNPPSLGVED